MMDAFRLFFATKSISGCNGYRFSSQQGIYGRSRVFFVFLIFSSFLRLLPHPLPLCCFLDFPPFSRPNKGAPLAPRFPLGPSDGLLPFRPFSWISTLSRMSTNGFFMQASTPTYHIAHFEFHYLATLQLAHSGDKMRSTKTRRFRDPRLIWPHVLSFNLVLKPEPLGGLCHGLHDSL